MNASFLVRLMLVLMVGLGTRGPLHADDKGGASDDGHAGAGADDDSGGDDHDLARDLVAAGIIRPLGDVVRVVAAEVPGRIVGVRLERDRDRWIYAFRVVTPDGRRVRVRIDAATLAIREGSD